MSIREMTRDDLPQVSRVCMEAFMASVASTLPAQGIETFRGIASVESFGRRMQDDTTLLVFADGPSVKGVVELKAGRHVAMLFVDPPHQGQGIGRRLVEAAISHARSERITVNASLPSVPAYTKYGFRCCSAVGESGGLVYQPMERRDTLVSDPQHAD